MIPQATVDRIISAANIVDVVSGYVSLRRSGASYKGLCPFHDDTTPSFYVSPARGVCKCFSCGEGGNVVHFIMKKEQLTYYEALKFLAKKYGIEVEERELTDEERQSQSVRESMFAVNEWASNHFHQTLLNTTDGQAIGMTYFRSRGFRDDIIEKFRLGFCLQKYDETAKAALKEGYKEEFLIKTGLCYKRDDGSLRDKYWGRVIFPWFGINGKITGFGGRVLDARTKGVNQKYINSPESEIYHKANELYGLFQAKGRIAKLDNVIMVEGYTDVLSMHQAGIENVVANSGTALSEIQVKLLRRYTRNITLIYDGDSAGIHAALRGTDMLLAGGLRVKILLLPDGDDPDSFARKHNATELQEYIDQHQTDFITFKANLYKEQAAKDPIKKSDLIEDIVNSISVIPEEITRSVYIHQCSELLAISEGTVQNAVNQTRKKNREEKAKLEAQKAQQAQATEQSASNSLQGNDASNTGSYDAGIGSDDIDSLVQSYEAIQGQGHTTNQTTVTSTDTADVQAHATSPSTGEHTSPATDGQQPQVPVQGSSTTASAARPIHKPKEESHFEGLERLIMMIFVRFGNKEFEITDEEGNTQTTTIQQYIVSQLQIDGLEFHSPLYRKMLELAAGSTDITKTLLNSPDTVISHEAADLLVDRYKLSQTKDMPTEEQLCADYIVHLILDYKYTVVNTQLKDILHRFTDPAVISDPAVASQLLQQQITLCAIQKQLAKALGDRTMNTMFTSMR
ncbi:MAG: DNA primase [Prevotellaceae bacterium]|nr:DNA primase [Candidatus Colivivens caballi]